ncbi:MAG: hypothetical protein QF824_02790 [Candidatus Woesearchaeota archaeon]|jgi:translation initiation factor IF-2|nr:hypothetical protein [Candidatus Woesearchaeota archaeon]
MEVYEGKLMHEEEIGVISHFFSNINVAVIKIEKQTLDVGDTIHIKGHTTDFEQKILSMQIEREKVEKAKKGQSIGLKIDQAVRVHDRVFKMME